MAPVYLYGSKIDLAITSSQVEMTPESHQQCYLMAELESLGLTSVRLNEFNDNVELKRLVNAIKEDLMTQYRNSTK